MYHITGSRGLALAPEEAEALKSMPEFQKALKKIRKQKRKAKKEAIRKSGFCEGAVPEKHGMDLKCPKCGLVIKYEGFSATPNAYRNHLSLMEGRHWNRPDRPDANPFTGNGMSGKAAASFDDDSSDWYMNH